MYWEVTWSKAKSWSLCGRLCAVFPAPGCAGLAMATGRCPPDTERDKTRLVYGGTRFDVPLLREGEKPSEKHENKNESRSRALSQQQLDGARGGFPTFSAALSEPLPGHRHRGQLSNSRNGAGRRRRGARHDNTPAKAKNINFLCVCD